MRVNKRILGAEKVKYKQQATIHHSMNYYLNHQAKRITSEAITSEVPTSKHPYFGICKWLMKHPHSDISSCDYNPTPQKDPLGSCISYITCIHLHSSVVKYLPCMVKNFDCTNTLLLKLKISVVKYRKVVKV